MQSANSAFAKDFHVPDELIPALRRTEPNPHMGRPGVQIAISNITFFRHKLFLLREVRKCKSGNRDLGTRTTHVGVWFSPPECWDCGKTAQAIVGHQNLKLQFFIL